ncbi:MAG TPA: adenosylcobinamide-GDP ribazoletransferase [Micromonosporaceae bacterium]|nr:adenosylcobinamide-GDP ribazoletransferase [Micromonosporaceae bacterium]
MNAVGGPPLRAGGLRDGLRLGAGTFTVAPVRAGVVDRDAARVAMVSAPAYGLVIGALVAAIAIGLRASQAPGLVTAVVCVGIATLATRGLHLDGLADTVDALGSYADRERALAIMRSPEVGPFGVVAIVFAVLVPVATIASMLDRPWWALLTSTAIGYASGRLGVTWACRVGVLAARSDGLGALVAGTVQPAEAVLASLAIGALAVAAVPHRPWQGPVAVVASLAATAIVTVHVRRRLGGITGDTLGACVEIGTAVAMIGVAW